MLLEESETQSGGAPPPSDTAADHLSHLLSRVREAMYGGAGVSRQEVPHNVGQDRNTNQSQYRGIIRLFPPKPVADFLSSCCYELATDSFFYFDQQAFQSKLDELFQNEGSHLRNDGIFLCLVLMVFALGSQFAHLRTRESPAYTSGTPRCPGSYFYSLAVSLLPMATFECSIQAMQVCLVTAVYLLPEHVYNRAYLYLSHALRIAISLDFHRQRLECGTSYHESEIKHRLWWSVFSLDRTVSIKLGRPASIASIEIHTPLPEPFTPMDNVQYFDNVAHQVANAKLVLLMDSIVKDTASGTTATNEGLQRIEQLQRSLIAWKARLTPELKLSRLDAHCRGYRTVVHLHLNFHFASILLCRSALLFLLRLHLHKLFGKSKEQEIPYRDRLERLADDCVDAGKSIIGLFEMLQQTDSLGMFSFTDFQGCSTATVVLLLESMRRGIETNSAFIDTGFSCLRYMATENQHAKTGIRYVEELRAAADEVIEKSAQLPIGKRDKSIGDYGMTAYQEWIQAVVDRHSAQTTDYESATMVEPSTIAEPTQNSALRSPNPESDFSTKGLQEPSKTVDESGQLTLQSASEFAVPTMALLEDPSDTFLFGLTGLDALDFLILDDQQQLPGFTGLDYDA